MVPRCGKRDSVALGKAHEMVRHSGPSSQLTDEESKLRLGKRLLSGVPRK